MKKILKISAVLLLVVITVALTRDDRLKSISKNLDIYYSLVRELDVFYVDTVDVDKLVKTSIDKMLSSLDPYTTYIPEDELKEFAFQTTGNYAGIGSLIRGGMDSVMVVEPYKGTPSDLAGLKPGDYFIEIDGKTALGIGSQKVSDLLKGKSNSEVKLVMYRPSTKKNYTVKFKREEIHVPAIPYSGVLKNGVGYIKLNGFTRGAAQDVMRAVISLKSEGATSILLDLRGNPGGLVNEANDIVNIFVPKGTTVVETKGRVERWDMKYVASKQPVDTEIPLAVLVNRGSASASEIVSGAIQDLDRGVVIGERTFGKGLVQATRDVSHNGKLKITTAKYYIPSGRCIQALDYSHRNEDGSVGAIPDSLMTEFTTKGGRTVKDGGGIVPDLKVKSHVYSALMFYLVSKNMIFDFATKYSYDHPEMLDLASFSIDDEVYDQFVSFIKEKNFTYKTVSEIELDEVVKTAKKENYYEESKDKFDALREVVAPNLERDVVKFRDEVSGYLLEEIVKRYHYSAGAIQISLKDDEVIEKADSILSNLDGYNEILKEQK